MGTIDSGAGGEHGSDEGDYFCYLPFEHQGFDIPDQLDRALPATVGTLLTHEARIVQTRRWSERPVRRVAVEEKKRPPLD